MLSSRLWSHFRSKLRPMHRTMSSVKLAYADYLPPTKSAVDTPPLVILHGMFGSRNNWQILSKKFSKSLQLRVVAVDARNHGESPHSPTMNYQVMAHDVADLLDTLKIKKAHILGHSMGGKAAMTLALIKPDYFESVIIEDSIPKMTGLSSTQFPDYIEAMQSLDLNLNGGSLAGLRTRAMNELAEAIPGIGVRAFLVQNIIRRENSTSAEWRLNLEAMHDNLDRVGGWEDDLVDGKQFTGPVSFIGGAKSPYLPKGAYTDRELSRILPYFPNAEHHVIPDAGHWVHSEQPDLFLDCVCKFINSL